MIEKETKLVQHVIYKAFKGKTRIQTFFYMQ